MTALVRRARPAALLLAPLAALLVALAGCGPLGATIGNDPCLLQSYQGHSNGNLGGMNGAYKTLAGQLDALQAPSYTISSSGDISETLNALSTFQTMLDKQLAYLHNSTPPAPPQAQPFLGHVAAAIPKLRMGVYMLAQAYLDAHADHMRSAQDIADKARGYMRDGAHLLLLASTDLANLHTDSVNC